MQSRWADPERPGRALVPGSLPATGAGNAGRAGAVAVLQAAFASPSLHVRLHLSGTEGSWEHGD